MKHNRSVIRRLQMVTAVVLALSLVPTTALSASAVMSRPATGTLMNVAGELADDMVTPEQMQGLPPAEVSPLRRAAPDFGVKRYSQQVHTIDVAVVAPSGSTGSTNFISDSAISDLVTGTGAFWKTQSNDQVSALNKTTVTKRYGSSHTCSDFSGVWDEAAVAFGRSDSMDYVSDQSRHLLVLVPAGCGGTGVGSFRGAANAASGGTIWVSISGRDDLSVVAHEFGHNLGLNHSNTHHCADPTMSEGLFDAAANTWSDGCQDEEYGDFFDLMGAGFSVNGVSNVRPIALNVTHKDLLGALIPGEVQDVVLPSDRTTITVATVLRSTGAASGLRALRVTDPITGQIYFVDFRGGGGYDAGSLYESGLGDWFGLNVGVRVLTQRADGSSIDLMSPDPNSEDGRKLYLDPGETLTTRSEGIMVRVRSISGQYVGNYANIEVTLSGSVPRLAGADRFSASAAISAASFTPGVSVAYVASGLNFPDALSGAPVAAKDGAPILLVAPGSIPATIRSELQRLRPGRIVVLGGVNSVSDAVKADLSTYTAGGVTRLWGADRFAASADISAKNFLAGVGTAYVANGLNFPDALSGAPVAAKDGAPILLVTPGSIPSTIRAELQRLRPGRIVVLGGVNSVSESVKADLSTYTAGGVTRLWGGDRFAASADISARNFDVGVATVYVASGLNFPDALSGAPVAGRDGAPILLVTPTTVPDSIRAELLRLKPANIVILGGPNSVSASVGQQLLTYIL